MFCTPISPLIRLIFNNVIDEDGNKKIFDTLDISILEFV